MATEANNPVVKPEVLEFSKSVQKELTCDAKTGIVTGDVQSVYDANLPEGITPDVVKKVSEYDAVAINGTVHAVGNIAIEAMKKNSGLERVTGDFTFGHRGALGVTVDRTKEVVNNFSPNKETMTKYGSISAEVKYKAGRGGQMTAVKKAIAAAAADALKK